MFFRPVELRCVIMRCSAHMRQYTRMRVCSKDRCSTLCVRPDRAFLRGLWGGGGGESGVIYAPDREARGPVQGSQGPGTLQRSAAPLRVQLFGRAGVDLARGEV